MTTEAKATAVEGRTMLPVAVYEGQDGHVVIKQDYGGEETVILLRPCQAPLVSQWIREVGEEMQVEAKS